MRGWSQKHRDSEMVWWVVPDQLVYEAIEKMADKGVGAASRKAPRT